MERSKRGEKEDVKERKNRMRRRNRSNRRGLKKKLRAKKAGMKKLYEDNKKKKSKLEKRQNKQKLFAIKKISKKKKTQYAINSFIHPSTLQSTRHTSPTTTLSNLPSTTLTRILSIFPQGPAGVERTVFIAGGQRGGNTTTKAHHQGPEPPTRPGLTQNSRITRIS